MRRYWTNRGSWRRTIGIVVLLIAVAGSCGCDALDALQIFGANWNINLYIPLGLDGGSGLLNPPGGSTIPSSANNGANDTPPIGGGLFD